MNWGPKIVFHKIGEKKEELKLSENLP